MAHRYGILITVETDHDGTPTAFRWRGRARRVTVIGEWRLITRWWVSPAAHAAGHEANGPSDRTYYRLLTADHQVFEVYRDDAAGGA